MHFYTQRDQDEQWHKTLIQVQEQTKPSYQLYTDGAKFKFATSEQTLFWGAMCSYYTGVWMLRNDETAYQESLLNKPIIQPITSADIEKYTTHQQKIQANNQEPLSEKIRDNHFFEYFASYFAQALIREPNSILHQGKWYITQGYDHSASDSQLCYTKNLGNEESAFRVYGIDEAFRSQLSYIDWWFNGSSELLPIKDKPHADSARVKWWRKKVKENTCPPVLVWFVNPLDAYIIIDGHSRLLAYQLENIPAKILVLSQYMHVPIKPHMQERQNMFKGLKSRLDSHEKNNTEPNIDDINQILIKAYAYDKNYYEKFITTGKAVDLTESWHKEVGLFFKNADIDKKSLQSMLDREKHDTTDTHS